MRLDWVRFSLIGPDLPREIHQEPPTLDLHGGVNISIRKEALVQQQIKTLHRDPKVLAKIYGLFYGANLSVYTAALLKLLLRN